MEENERDTLPPSPTTSPLEAATELTDRVTRQWAAQPRGAARAFPIPTGPDDIAAWDQVIACYNGGDTYAFHILVRDQRETLLEYADPKKLGPGDADDVVSLSSNFSLTRGGTGVGAMAIGRVAAVCGAV